MNGNVRTIGDHLYVAVLLPFDRQMKVDEQAYRRFLRHFLYQGFNIDEQDRKVFDGLMPHVSGGGLGFFNHRFAQPTRHNAQHEEHLYPADVFPFTYGDAADPFRKRSDGILRRLAGEDPKLLPKVMHTQSAAEYWHRSGSLVHTDPLASRDETLPDNVRLYAFGGTQHGPAADPPGRGIADNLLNPGDYRPFLRALLDALDAWVKYGTEPPPSVYPRIDKGTLVGWTQKESSGAPYRGWRGVLNLSPAVGNAAVREPAPVRPGEAPLRERHGPADEM